MKHFAKHAQRNVLTCSMVIVFLITFVFAPAAHAANGLFGGGTGLSGDPYIIEDEADLDAVRNGLTAHYRLGNNIDLTTYLASGGDGYAQWGTDGWEPIGDNTTKFTGSLDGAGYKITGLWINRDTEDYVGLFGYIVDATIENLGIELASAEIKGHGYVGGFAGWQESDFSSCSITNCYITGNITATNECVGGMVGRLYALSTSSCIISDCHTTGNVTGHAMVGGLVGMQVAYPSSINSIENCHSIGNVMATGNAVGGLVGRQFGYGGSCSIIKCYSNGGVEGWGNVGGLVGYQEADNGNNKISQCYVTGSNPVTANLLYTGGLVGYQEAFNNGSNSIINCYTAVNVNGQDEVGGLVGLQKADNGNNSIAYCYTTGNAYASVSKSGGLAGSQVAVNGGDNSITSCYSIGNITTGSDAGGIVGYQDAGLNSVNNCFRYLLATVNNAVTPDTDPDYGQNKRHGEVSLTAVDFMTQTTYSANGWSFGAGGPWYWDAGEKYPRLNMSDEAYPFPFYTITYHTNGGVLPSDAQFSYLRGEMYVLPNITMTGYRFDGWFNSANQPVQTIRTTDSGHKEFWAKWTLLVVPRINGSTSMQLDKGYTATSTEAFTITGTTPVTVIKLSGDERITWNNTTKKLDIAAGLPIGVYEVRLQASNEVSSFTFTFTLTVAERVYYIGVALSYEGGRIEAITNTPYLAVEGETVTLIITPDEGYELVSIYVVDYNNAKVIIPLSGTGLTRTFIMPAHHITVVAVFMPVTRTGNEQSIINTGQLKAWTVNGVLHVSGQTAGMPLNVYNLNGAPVFQGIAAGEKMDVVLPGRGVYIVTDGNQSVKVMY